MYTPDARYHRQWYSQNCSLAASPLPPPTQRESPRLTPHLLWSLQPDQYVLMVQTGTWPNSGGIGRRGLVFITAVLLAVTANTSGEGYDVRRVYIPMGLSVSVVVPSTGMS